MKVVRNKKTKRSKLSKIEYATSVKWRGQRKWRTWNRSTRGLSLSFCLVYCCPKPV